MKQFNSTRKQTNNPRPWSLFITISLPYDIKVPRWSGGFSGGSAHSRQKMQQSTVIPASHAIMFSHAFNGNQEVLPVFHTTIQWKESIVSQI